MYWDSYVSTGSVLAVSFSYVSAGSVLAVPSAVAEYPKFLPHLGANLLLADLSNRKRYDEKLQQSYRTIVGLLGYIAI